MRKETLVEKRKDEEIAEKENQLKSLRAAFQEMMGKEAARSSSHRTMSPKSLKFKFRQVWLDQETQKQARKKPD